jgi:hypothetical protein
MAKLKLILATEDGEVIGTWTAEEDASLFCDLVDLFRHNGLPVEAAAVQAALDALAASNGWV